MKKIVAGAVALCLMGGALIGSEPVSPEFTASASEEESYTEGTYGDLTYKKYSDHVVISGCVQTALKAEIPEKIEGLPVTAIDSWAFTFCTALATVKIPNSVKSIGDNAFYGCKSLYSINIPSGVEKIEHLTFYECQRLHSITLPDTVKSIDWYSFAYCMNLTSVVIPDSVEIIEECAFYNCRKLESITIKNPSCEIYDEPLTIINFAVADHEYFNGTIYGAVDSTAQEYAEKYDYKFSAFSKGDVDRNGTIDALDASMVLIEYAAAATGKASTLDDSQKKSADVNEDGAIDALDASDILRYYSFTATGGTGSIEEFLAK